MDINYGIWAGRFIRIIVAVIVGLSLIGTSAFYGQSRYQAYVVATTVPEAPEVILEKKEDVAHLTINCKDDREGKEFVVYISEDGEKFEELLVTTKTENVVEGLELGKKYHFKAQTRVFYDKEEIASNHSEVANVTLDVPVEVVEPVPVPQPAPSEETVINGFEGYSHPIHSSAAKWAPEVERQLRNFGVYTEERKLVILNIIHHESTGNENAYNSAGGYAGLVQFGTHWKHDYPESYFIENDIPGAYSADNRFSGNWSIHRIVQVLAEGGDDAIKQHWAGTWNK